MLLFTEVPVSSLRALRPQIHRSPGIVNPMLKSAQISEIGDPKYLKSLLRMHEMWVGKPRNLAPDLIQFLFGVRLQRILEG